MKRFTKIVSALLATVLVFSIAGCDKSSYPDFYNPAGGGEVETGEHYVINVTSEGGYALDGVKVSAVKDGMTRKTGISRNGKIELGVTLDEYELVIDEESLPAGYYMPTDTYKTDPDRRTEVNIKIPSAIISQAATSDKRYVVGEIINDFRFTDCYDKEYVLSDLFENGKKAVVLNFWFSDCGPCASEFPSIQRAYTTNAEIEILAIASTHYGDTNEIVKNYKKQNPNDPESTEEKYTFPMGIDQIGMNTKFGVKAWPTTVIVDRYGMIAYKSKGTETSVNYWTSLFTKFTSDSYVQDPTGTGGDGNGPTETERVKPNVTMPESEILSAQASGAGLAAVYRGDEADEYSWPFLAGNGYIYSSNKGVGNSYSQVFIDIDMKENDVLTLDYYVSSEAGMDILFALIDGVIVNGDGWSATDGWMTANLYVADRDTTIELALIYRKDEADPTEEGAVGEDEARIKNIRLEQLGNVTFAEPIDVMRPCASGVTEGNGKYDDYVKVVKGDDGFYHKDTADGSLIYICLLTQTPWSDMHTGDTVTVGNSTIAATMYLMTYYKYAVDTNSQFNVTIGTTDVTETLQTMYTAATVMESPYYLIPVTDGLKVWAEAFVAEYEKEIGSSSHDNEWLELCYYYSHYGSADNAHDGDGHCRLTTDPTRGLLKSNSYTAYIDTADELKISADNENKSETIGTADGRNKALINFALNINNGSYYKFTAGDAGVYQIRSYTRGCSGSNVGDTVNPGINVYNESGRRIASAETVYDLDQFTSVNYEGFNTYVYLTAGQTVYLHLTVENSTTGYYEFSVSYKGESFDTMFVCSTGDGSWTYYEDTGIFYYIAIDVAYDRETDCYYKADRSGNPIKSQPVYIDMVHPSYFMSELAAEGMNFQPLEDYINSEYFVGLLGMGDESQHNKMVQYLSDSTYGKELDDFDYGMVKANREIVEILNKFIDVYVDGGRGEANGWLAFACYMEHFGA